MGPAPDSCSMAAPASPPRKTPFRPQASTPAPKPPRGPGAGAAILPLCILAAVGAAGWFAYGEYQKNRTAEAAPEPEKTPAPIVVPDIPVIKLPDIVPVVKTPEPDQGKTPEPEKVAEKKPALPEIPSLQGAAAPAALKEATLARIADGRWTEHIALVRTAALAAVKTRSRSEGPTMLERPSSNGMLPLGLAQLELFDRLGEEGLKEFAKSRPEFAARLLTTPDMAELFADYVAPEDSVADALRVWSELDAREATAKDKLSHRNLALALALIHDKPGDDEHVGEVYAYYRKAEADHKLYYDSSKIPPDELVWAVADSSFPLSEYRWALKNLKYPVGKLADAYGSVPYRSKHEPYGDFTMSAVLRIGGVCHQRAQYTEANARARGVPCVYIHDTGGIHAWIAYKTPKGWETEFGGGGGNFGCGIGGIFSTGNPQTGKPVREWDLHLYDDKGRRNGDFKQAKRILFASKLDLPADEKLELYGAAAQRDPGNPESWRPWFAALVADKKVRSTSYWQNLVTRFRSEMKETPDYFEMSDSIESAKVFPQMPADSVAQMLGNRRRSFIHTYPNRYDLVAVSLRREGEHYLSIKDKERFKKCYLTALRDYVKQLPAYIIIVEDFGELAKDQPDVAKEGIAVIDKMYPKEIDKKLALAGGHLWLNLKANVSKKIAAVCLQVGNAERAAWYEERARLLKEKADEQAAAGN